MRAIGQMGDFVRIVECRPLSRLKRWTLGDVIRRAVEVGVDIPRLRPMPTRASGRR